MQSCLFQGRQVYSTGFFVTVSPVSIASSHGKVLRKTYGTNLSAPFIMQVSPFKAVQKSLIPNVGILATWPRGDAGRVPVRLLRLWSPLLTIITSLLTWSHPLAHRVSVRFSSLNDGITHTTVVMIVGWRASVCGYAEVCAPSLIGSGAHLLLAKCDPFCALQAYLKVRLLRLFLWSRCRFLIFFPLTLHTLCVHGRLDHDQHYVGDNSYNLQRRWRLDASSDNLHGSVEEDPVANFVIWPRRS